MRHGPDSPKTPYPQLNPIAIIRQLECILSSRTLARANYLLRLLRCCVEQTLLGNSGQLKELWLGKKVFYRKDSFDPRRDPIVRVQARRLREKLAAYYSEEGRLDAVRITLPLGSYVPVFSTLDLKRWANIPAGRPCSIAVLPLSHLDDDPNTDLFADVITNELTNALVHVGDLDVVSRTSSMIYKGVAADVRSIGSHLNADFIVEGSVRVAGDRYRITLQLSDCTTGYHCWSAWFEHRISRVAPDAVRIAELLRQELLAGGLTTMTALAAVAS
jgi:serine/threonine-protein kinase